MLRVLDLAPLFRLAPKLLDELEHLGHPGGAERVAFGLQAAGGVDRELAIDPRFSLHHGLPSFAFLIEDAAGYGDTTLSLDDLAVKAFVQSDTGEACQPGYVDSFCMDKTLNGQKRADALKYITWVTDRKTVVKQIAPSPDFVRYLSPARLSIYLDAELNSVAPLYKQLLPIMELARYFPPPDDWDWAPDLEGRLEEILPTN